LDFEVFARAIVGGTTFPNTDNDESATLENEERRPTPTTSSDEVIRVKIMTDTLSDLE